VGDSGVSRGGKPEVSRMGYNFRARIFCGERAYGAHGVVRAAIIDKDDFYIAHGLGVKAVQASVYIFFDIIYGDDDGYFGFHDKHYSNLSDPPPVKGKQSFFLHRGGGIAKNIVDAGLQLFIFSESDVLDRLVPKNPVDGPLQFFIPRDADFPIRCHGFAPLSSRRPAFGRPRPGPDSA